MIKNDWQADKAIEDIQELEQEIARLEKLANKKIEQVKASLKSSVDSLQLDIDRQKEAIKYYIMTEPEGKVQNLKTMNKYTLNAGEVRIKKGGYKLLTSSFNNDDLIKYLEQTNRKDLIKQTVSFKPDWKEYKSRLELKDNIVIDTETGEVVEFIKPKFYDMEVEIK